MQEYDDAEDNVIIIVLSVREYEKLSAAIK